MWEVSITWQTRRGKDTPDGFWIWIKAGIILTDRTSR